MTRTSLIVAIVLITCGAAPRAQEPPPQGTVAVSRPAPEGTRDPQSVETPTQRGDDDEPDVAALTIGRWLTLSGSVQAEWDAVRRPAGVAQGALEPEAGSAVQVRTTVTPRDWLTLFVRTEIGRTFRTDAPDWWQDGRTDGRLVEAYLDVDRLFGAPVGVRIGRQRFRDAREWFFDDNLDAVRLRSQVGRWRFDVAFANGITSSPAIDRDTPQRQHVIATVSRRVTRAMRATAFYVRRGDVAARADRPWWAGGSLASRGEHQVMFHALGAVQRGRRGDVRLHGWAADAGLRWHIPATGRPALSVGYARASGDASTSDGIDSGFRQTDLQDNSARVGGLRRVRMYGEVFDPELANMQILTIAASLRPARALSIDVLAHHYSQVVPRRRLASTAFKVRASGDATRLGREIDLQVVARVAARMDLRLVVGAFRPGAAFEALPGADTQTLVWRPQVRLYF